MISHFDFSLLITQTQPTNLSKKHRIVAAKEKTHQSEPLRRIQYLTLHLFLPHTELELGKATADT